MFIKDAKIYVPLLVFISVFVEKGQSELSQQNVQNIIEDIIHKRFDHRKLQDIIKEKNKGRRQQMAKGGQFTIALSLTKDECDNGKMERSNVDFQKVVEDMANGVVFNSGGVTAAIPLFTYIQDAVAAQKEEVHSEYRVLNELKSNFNKASDKVCLILYTHNSPCRESCLEGKVANIIQPLNDVFRKVDNGYKAVVFDHIYRDDKMQTRERVFNSLKKIPVKTYCCYYNTVFGCALLDHNKRANDQECLSEMDEGSQSSDDDKPLRKKPKNN